MPAKRLGSAIGICIGVFVGAMDWSIVNNALSSIQIDLAANSGELQWIMNAFGLAVTVFLVTMGRFGDAYGRRRMFFHWFCSFLASLH